jgi:hypothetical protein
MGNRSGDRRSVPNGARCSVWRQCMRTHSARTRCANACRAGVSAVRVCYTACLGARFLPLGMGRSKTGSFSLESLLPDEAAEALTCTVGEILRCLHNLGQSELPLTGTRTAPCAATSDSAHLATGETAAETDVERQSDEPGSVSVVEENYRCAPDWATLLQLVQDVLLFLSEWDECLNRSFGERVGGVEAPSLDWYVGTDGVVAEAGLVPLAARRAVIRTGVLEAALAALARLPLHSVCPPGVLLNCSDAMRYETYVNQVERFVFGIMKLIVAITLPPPVSLVREAKRVLQQTTKLRGNQRLDADSEWSRGATPFLAAALALREALEEIQSQVLRLGSILLRQWNAYRNRDADARSAALEWIAHLFIGAAKTLPSSWPHVELCLLFFATFLREPSLLDRPVSWSEKHIPAAFERETRQASLRETHLVAQRLLLLLMRSGELDLFRVVHAVVMQAPHIDTETEASTCGTTESVINAALEIYHAAWVRFYPAASFADQLITEMHAPADRYWKTLFSSWEPLREKLERERALRGRESGFVRPSRWATKRPSAWIIAPEPAQPRAGGGPVPLRKRVALDADEIWEEIQRDRQHGRRSRSQQTHQRDRIMAQARRADLGLLRTENAIAFYHPHARVGALPPSWTRLAALAAPASESSLHRKTMAASVGSDETGHAAVSWQLWSREAGLAVYELGHYGIRELERAAQDPLTPPWAELTAFLELSSAVLEMQFWDQAAHIVNPFECGRKQAVLLLLEGYGYGTLPDDPSAWPSLHAADSTRDPEIMEMLHRELSQQLYRGPNPNAADERFEKEHEPPAEELIANPSSSTWQRALMDLLLSDRALGASLRILCAAIQARKERSKRLTPETEDLFNGSENVDMPDADAASMAVARSIPFETIMRWVFLQWRALIAEIDGFRRLRALWCTHRSELRSLPGLIQHFDGRRCSRLHLDQVISLVWFLWVVGRSVLSASNTEQAAESAALAQELQLSIQQLPRLGHCLMLPLYEVLLHTWPATLYRTSGWLRALDLLQQIWSSSMQDTGSSADAPAHLLSWHALLVCAAAIERSTEHPGRRQRLFNPSCAPSLSSALQDFTQLGLSVAHIWRREVISRPLVLVEALAASRRALDRTHSVRRNDVSSRRRQCAADAETDHGQGSRHVGVTSMQEHTPADAVLPEASGSIQESITTVPPDAAPSAPCDVQAHDESSESTRLASCPDTDHTPSRDQSPLITSDRIASRMRDRHGHRVHPGAVVLTTHEPAKGSPV